MANNFNRSKFKITNSASEGNYLSPQFGYPSTNANYNQQQQNLTRTAVVSAGPTLYASAKRAAPQENAVGSQSSVNFAVINDEVQKQLKRLREKVTVPAQQAIAQGRASTASQSIVKRQKLNQDKKLLRTAGGTTWHDSTLADWPDDDFRVFCGDLGNDVTDELLTKTFKVYPSFLRARVVRDRRTNKTKGFGFVSFKNLEDYVKAMREMNGRFVGSRPIKLQKSNWKNRAVDVVRKKEEEKAALVELLKSQANQ